MARDLYRTDVLQKEGVDEAIKLRPASVEVGADAAFIEGITTEEEATRVIKELPPTPYLVNRIANRVTGQ